MPERAHGGCGLRSAFGPEGGSGAGRPGTGADRDLPPYLRVTLDSCSRAVAWPSGHGISLVNTPGLIDSGYRGEIRVPLINHDREETSPDRGGNEDRALVLAGRLGILRRGSSWSRRLTGVGKAASAPPGPSVRFLCDAMLGRAGETAARRRVRRLLRQRGRTSWTGPSLRKPSRRGACS